MKNKVKGKVITESPDLYVVRFSMNNIAIGYFRLTPYDENSTYLSEVSFSKEYDDDYIIDDSILLLWELFPDLQRIYIQPTQEYVDYWNHRGFNLFTDDILSKDRGH